MSETKIDTGGKKQKTCLIAILAPSLVILGYCWLALLETLEKVPIPKKYLAFLAPFLWLTAIASGITALVKIKKSKGKLVGRFSAILGIVVATLVLWLSSSVWLYYLGYDPIGRFMCQHNLTYLRTAIRAYADDNEGKYPIVHKWCDLLVEGKYATEKPFICRRASSQDDNIRCTYATNPDCEPNSPGNMVLLFETRGAWNQFGGPEILTTENHGGKGCNVLFNNGSVKFVKTKDLTKLKWQSEEAKTD